MENKIKTEEKKFIFMNNVSNDRRFDFSSVNLKKAIAVFIIGILFREMFE